MISLKQQWYNNMRTRYYIGGLVAAGIVGFLMYFVSAWGSSHHPAAILPLRIMTYNIEGGHSDRKQILAVLRQHTPDLVFLQEVPRPRLVQRFGEQLQLPFFHFTPYPGRHGSGIAVLSRWPLGPAQTLVFARSNQGKVALAAQVHLPTTTFWVCSVHLDAPRLHEFGTSFLQQGAFVLEEFLTSSLRYHQARELQAWLSRLADGAWLVAGDFNSMPFSSTDRYVSKYYDDVLLKRPWRYFTGTFWDLPQSPIRPRLDYIYHSPHFRVLEARVIQHKASDHFPVLAVVAPPTAPQPAPTPQTLPRQTTAPRPRLPAEARVAVSSAPLLRRATALSPVGLGLLAEGYCTLVRWAREG